MAERYSQSCPKPNDATVNEAEFDDTLFNVRRPYERAAFSTSNVQESCMEMNDEKRGIYQYFRASSTQYAFL